MKQINPSKRSEKWVFVLIAPGFDEMTTAYLIGRLRQASIPVQLVGVTPGLMAGLYGISLQTDNVLGKLDGKKCGVLIFSEGRQSLIRLLIDPRLQGLIQATIQNDGHIIGDDEVFSTLFISGVLSSESASHFTHMPDLTNQNAIQEIINMLL